MFLYAYCYCMSALLIQRTLLARQLKALATWVVALLLLGLGSVLPYMLAYFLAPEMVPYGHHDQAALLTNPFVSIEEALREGRHLRYDPVRGVTPSVSLGDVTDASVFGFLAVWATLVTVLALPWFVRQVRQFRPLECSWRDWPMREERRPAVSAEEVEELPLVEPSES